MVYGFLDEAGDVGTGQGASAFVVVALVLTTDPRQLRREVKKFRTRLGKRKLQIPEFKASNSPHEWNRKRLERLATLNVEIVVIVGEKAGASQRTEPEKLYDLLCARAVEECLRRHPALILRCDKRYTNPRLRVRQERALRSMVPESRRILTVEYIDSIRDPALQQADVVAWAFYQKYTHGDGSFAACIHERISAETVLRKW